MAYDMKTSRWRPLRVALPPKLVFAEYPSLKRVWKGNVHIADVLPPVLVECNKRLLLIGFREDHPSLNPSLDPPGDRSENQSEDRSGERSGYTNEDRFEHRSEERFVASVAGAAIWELGIGKNEKSKAWRLVSTVPDALFKQAFCPAAVTHAAHAATTTCSYLQYELRAAARGSLAYVFHPKGGVLLCDLAASPPTWRSIRRNVVGEDWSGGLQGCVLDLRFDDTFL